MLLSYILSELVWVRSNHLHWTSTGADPNGYVLESDPKLVRLAGIYTSTHPAGAVQTESPSIPILLGICLDPFQSKRGLTL